MRTILRPDRKAAQEAAQETQADHDKPRGQEDRQVAGVRTPSRHGQTEKDVDRSPVDFARGQTGKEDDRSVRPRGVHCRDRPEVDGAAFARQMGITFPQLLDGDSITVQYQIRGIPAFFIIGPEGRLMYQSVGFDGDSEARLEAMIQQYLDAKS